MHEAYENRMSTKRSKRGRPRKDDYQPEQIVEPDEVQLVRRCPVCGAARVGQWTTMRGRLMHDGSKGSYQRCGACGGVFYISSHGIRQVR